MIKLLLFIFLLQSLLHRRRIKNALCCGLVGFSGPKAPNTVLLRWLLISNQTRGSDATGIFGNQIYKNNVPATTFVKNPGFINSVNGSKAIIGHTRRGTTGKNTKENAHPFKVGKKGNQIVGTHNGWLIDQLYDETCEKLGLEPSNVDSYTIFDALHKYDFDFQVLSYIEGPMALGFVIPKYKDHLYLYRRPSKPLYIAESSEGLYYSSQEHSLDITGCYNIRELEPDVVHTFKHGVLLDYTPVSPPKIVSLPSDAKINSLYSLPSHEKKLIINHSGGNNNSGHGGSTNAKGKQNSQSSTSAGKNSTSTARMVRNTSSEPQQALGFQIPESKDWSVDSWCKIARDSVQQFKSKTNNLIRLDFINATHHSTGDYNECMVFVKVMDNVHKSGLVAWTILCNEIETIHAISVYNGIACFKIPAVHCDKELTFSLWNPTTNSIDDEVFVTKPLIFKTSRVVEVTLIIPFQGHKKIKNDNIKLQKQSDAIEGTTKHGRANTIDGEQRSDTRLSDNRKIKSVKEIVQESRGKRKGSKHITGDNKDEHDKLLGFPNEQTLLDAIHHIRSSKNIEETLWSDANYISKDDWEEMNYGNYAYESGLRVHEDQMSKYEAEYDVWTLKNDAIKLKKFLEKNTKTTVLYDIYYVRLAIELNGDSYYKKKRGFDDNGNWIENDPTWEKQKEVEPLLKNKYAAKVADWKKRLLIYNLKDMNESEANESAFYLTDEIEKDELMVADIKYCLEEDDEKLTKEVLSSVLNNISGSLYDKREYLKEINSMYETKFNL